MKIPNYSIIPINRPPVRRLYLWLHKHGPDWLMRWVRAHSPAAFPWVVAVEQRSGGCFHIRMATRNLALQQLAHNLEQGRVARIHFDWIAVALGWIL